MENKINEMREEINRNISELIKEEYKYANYALALRNEKISFSGLLIDMKELKHSFMKLDKELAELN